MIQLMPIAQTVVDWNNFYKLTHSLLRRNLAAGLDAANLPTRDVAAFVACLGELVDENQVATETLRQAGALLRHASISFLLVGPETLIHELAIEGCLSIVENESRKPMTIAVVSGTLEQWRNTIINGLTTHTTYELRKFCQLVLLQFDKMKLGKLFEKYGRRDQTDGTLALERLT